MVARLIQYLAKRTMSNPANLIDTCKSNAAKAAVYDNINADCIVGIGSGSTMRFVVEHLKQRCQESNFNIKCIPTSFQAKQLIYDYGLPIAELDSYPKINVTIDGADEIDAQYVAIKGGGACLAQEKVVAFAAEKFVVVADQRKDSIFLGEKWLKGIPIEVLPMAYQAVRYHIVKEFQIKLDNLPLRIGKEKAGPVITDNGNFIIDLKFDTTKSKEHSAVDWLDWSNKIKLIPGVVETGIFANMISTVYFGCDDGSVIKRNRRTVSYD